jgi:hypothetical protein
MTVFADCDFYKTEYLCGKKAVIDTASFKFYAKKATQKIKEYTLDNIDESNIPEYVKLCCCEIAELLYNSDNSGAGNGIASESVGDQSISYESSDSQRQALSKNIKSVIYSYLSGTGLLYRGVK